VTTTDAAALRQARLALEALQGQGVPQDRILLVVNQVYEGCPVTLREVSSFLGMEAAGELVADRRLVEEATLEGKPVVLAAPTHPLVVGVLAIAAQLCPGLPVLAPESRRRFRVGLPGWLRRFGQ
jgi:Flp pilus assembly CpaE family ATPase